MCLHRKFGLCINEIESIFDVIKRPTTVRNYPKKLGFYLCLPNAASCIFIVVYNYTKFAS